MKSSLDFLSSYVSLRAGRKLALLILVVALLIAWLASRANA